MLGDLLVDLIVELAVRPLMKVVDAVGGGVKRLFSGVRTRFQSDGDDQQAHEAEN
ncbi:hypothetical protein [Haloferax sp. YSSS75]|uniref:hypothetical protein n=1 Tax=Haloferax sp. YSSS75 TaxID=3388564 RepID=UPI00398C8595